MVWEFVLSVKSFIPVFSAIFPVFTAVAEKKDLKTNRIPWKLNYTTVLSFVFSCL